jgi:hypothetical protein
MEGEEEERSFTVREGRKERKNKRRIDKYPRRTYPEIEDVNT